MPGLIKMALAIPHIGEAVSRLRCALHEVRPRAMWVDDERALLVAWLAAPSELPLAYFVRSELRSIRPYCAPAWCRVDAALGVSEYSLRYLRSTCYAHCNLHVVGSGIDVDRTLERAGVPASVQGRDTSALRVACPILLPRPLKGHQVGMLAVGNLNRLGGQAELWLCAHARSVRSLGDQVSALAIDLGVQEHVRTLGGRQDILSVMAGSDVVLFPCPAEDHLQLVLEAMALGKPIVAAQIGAVPELVRDGVDGILVPPGDVQATVHALETLSEPIARKRMGAAGQRRARQRFSLDQQASRFLRAIDALREADWISRDWLLSASTL